MHPLTHTTLVGNWATLLLATNKNGEIDYKRMGDEIDILIASSPCGIYSNGTAGEFYTQNEEEFIKTSELLAEKCSAASIPFQIGVSHMSPQISLNRLQAVKSLNPGAVQVILPDWSHWKRLSFFCKGWKKRQTEFLSSFTILLMQKRYFLPMIGCT